MLRMLESISSSKLFLLAKTSLIGGALLVLLGALGQSIHFAFSFALSLGAIGVLLILGGYFLYKKASANRRKYEWREAYHEAQFAK